MDSNALEPKRPLRRVPVLALLILLALAPIGTSVHALDHQLLEADEDCALCLVGGRFEAPLTPTELGVDIAPIHGVFVPHRRHVATSSLLNGPRARAPPRASS